MTSKAISEDISQARVGFRLAPMSKDGFFHNIDWLWPGFEIRESLKSG